MGRPRPEQIAPDTATNGQVLVFNSVTETWEPTSIDTGKTVEVYNWFQDTVNPYLPFKGVTYTVQGRLMFRGTNERTPTKIYALYQVDPTTSANILVYDATNDNNIVLQTGLTNTAWTTLDMGTISNLSATPAIWELQLLTSAPQKSIRVSSMTVEY